MTAVELEPLIQPKKPLHAALAVVIVLVILLPSVILSMMLYLWVGGFMSNGEEAGVEVVDGTQAVAMSTWSKTTGTSASATVISTSPGSGIEWSEITWYLFNASTGAVDTGAVFSYTDADNDGYLDAGDTVTVIASASGTYKVRAIVGGSVIYESMSFTI